MTLTARQRDALELYAAGRTVAQIADELGVSPRQVKRELEHARREYDAPTTATAYIRYRNTVRRRQPAEREDPGLWGPVG